jgi:hypothetical protein
MALTLVSQWSAQQVAERALNRRGMRRRLRRVGLVPTDLLNRVEMAVRRSDKTKDVRDRPAHRWASACNEIDKIFSHERRHYRGRRYDYEKRLDTLGTGMRRVGGVWKAYVNLQRAQTPEEKYAAKERIEQMLTHEQLQIFILRVAHDHTFEYIAKFLRKRKSHVMEQWRTIQAELAA